MEDAHGSYLAVRAMQSVSCEAAGCLPATTNSARNTRPPKEIPTIAPIVSRWLVPDLHQERVPAHLHSKALAQQT